MNNLAFIGLGVMGFPMAGHLAKAGHNLKVYNRNPHKSKKWRSEFGGQIAATPAEQTTIISTISFAYKAIGNQTFVIDLTPKSFVEMIAPARTFGFKDQFQELSELGLIKGGSLENAIVCDGDK